MYAPPDYAQASARLREDVVTEGGETYGGGGLRSRKGMHDFFQWPSLYHILIFTPFTYISFYLGPGTQGQVLANTKETARNQFVVPLVNRK